MNPFDAGLLSITRSVLGVEAVLRQGSVDTDCQVIYTPSLELITDTGEIAGVVQTIEVALSLSPAIGDSVIIGSTSYRLQRKIKADAHSVLYEVR